MTEKDKNVEENKDLQADRVDGIIRVLALLAGISLIVWDKILHNVEPPVDMWVYGLLAGLATGNESLLNLFKGGKK